jgi:predicted dienelactone hydrolase
MTRFSTAVLVSAAALVVAGHAAASQAGWRQISIAGTAPGETATVVALYYPTRSPERAVPMGPFTPRVAIGAAPEATVKGLIVLSHGTGGSELGHSSLAEALARDGWLVAAIRHPGDNWQDRSMLHDRPDSYFSDRPRQVTRVIDALLRDPQWKDRLAGDASGPRIGAVGHSAGGYTVLALAGGEPELSRIARHCRDEPAEDPIFCGMGRSGAPAAAATSPAALADTRVRAVVALAPVGVVFTSRSLASIRIPVAIYEAEADRFLVPRFHAEWIAKALPGVQLHRVPLAWHFAFLDPPAMAIPSEDGDIGADPPGFDRRAFLGQLAAELTEFFDAAFR